MTDIKCPHCGKEINEIGIIINNALALAPIENDKITTEKIELRRVFQIQNLFCPYCGKDVYPDNPNGSIETIFKTEKEYADYKRTLDSSYETMNEFNNKMEKSMINNFKNSIENLKNEIDK